MKIFYFFFFLLAPVYAHAYLDPGTGSLLLYAVIGSVASLIFALRNFWYWLLEKILGTRSGKYRQNLPDIVFHSEGGRYWQVFEPVLTALLEKNVLCAYITPDPKDPGLSFAPANSQFSPVNPGNELMTIAFLNRIKARVLVSTTPNLDVYMWKRSKEVRVYAHLFHAPTGVDFYEKYALSFYDVILTVGPFQDKGIRELDLLRNLPPKKYYPAGCTYYDFMLRELNNLKRTTNSFAVLYAPSWGLRSSIARFGSDILASLVSSGIPVIFRPHPQSFISDSEMLQKILTDFGNNPLVTIDKNPTGIQSMLNSDILVTDLSGMLFDYAYLFSRPVILACSDASKGGYEIEDLSENGWDIPSAIALSRLLTTPDTLPALVTEIRENYQSAEEKVHSFRSNNLYNFGTSGATIADTLIQLSGETE